MPKISEKHFNLSEQQNGIVKQYQTPLEIKITVVIG